VVFPAGGIDPVLTVKAAAEKVGVSESLIYEWCQQGILPHYRFGRPGKRGKIMVDAAELAVFIETCRVQGTQEDDGGVAYRRHAK
jgi:excisionase family DNA binding protein